MYLPLFAPTFSSNVNDTRLRREGMVAMGSLSVMHWMLFGAVALLLFGGKGKISDIMGDVAKGIKSFKKGMTDEDAPAAEPAARAVEARAPAVTESRENQKVG